jgi:hypothetical protein
VFFNKASRLDQGTALLPDRVNVLLSRYMFRITMLRTAGQVLYNRICGMLNNRRERNHQRYDCDVYQPR